MENIKMPFKGKYPITQNFGVKVNYMRCGYHTGIDFGLPNGTDLISVCDGEIIVCEKWRLTGYGREVQIKREDGLIVQYAHMSEVYVVKGQKIEAGTIIGKSGNSGFWISLTGGKGYHLHFGTMFENNWFDPKKLLEIDYSQRPKGMSKAEYWAKLTGGNKEDFEVIEETINEEEKISEKAMPIKIEVKDDNYKFYIVEKGDSLWKIAQCFLHNGNRWKEIWAINKDTLTDPKRIKTGQKLKIPKI